MVDVSIECDALMYSTVQLKMLSQLNLAGDIWTLQSARIAPWSVFGGPTGQVPGAKRAKPSPVGLSTLKAKVLETCVSL